MLEFFSVNKIAFTIFSYPMSYIELVGTVCYLWSVWLISQRNMLTWPIGIISVLLYMVLFYQIRLYSDALEQIYYFGASVYGWWYWGRARENSIGLVDVHYSSKQWMLGWIGLTIVASLATGILMSKIHMIFPTIFPERASFPFLDAFTTIMSFTAMWLMARRKIESWIYWIIVDIIGIGLYYTKEVKFISLLYIILLCLAIKGLISWYKSAKETITDISNEPKTLPIN